MITLAIPWRPTAWRRHLAKQVIAAEKIFKCEHPTIQRGHACLVCTSDLPYAVNRQWTCSDLCRAAHKRAKARAKYYRKLARSHKKPSEIKITVPISVREPIGTVKCGRCGEFFQYDRTKFKWRSTCDTCWGSPRQQYKRKYTICVQCGGSLGKSRSLKFCGDQCRVIYQTPPPKPLTNPKCLHCGEPNPPHPHDRKYCSRECLVAVKDKSPEARARKSQRTHERYVRMRGAYLATLAVEQIVAEGRQRPDET
jgi:predicted nucleic acid-binding Zn ribbon protein